MRPSFFNYSLAIILDRHRGMEDIVRLIDADAPKFGPRGPKFEISPAGPAEFDQIHHSRRNYGGEFHYVEGNSWATVQLPNKG